MADHALKTGKKPATYDRKDLHFADFVNVREVLQKVPRTFGHENAKLLKHSWAMLGNGPDDSVAPGFEGAGDCVFAGAANETRVWTGETGDAPAPFTGKEAIAAYSEVTGYRLNDPSTDQGTNVRDALNWRRHTGLRDHAGNVHKIAAYLSLEPGNHEHVLAAMYLFGAVGIGIEFPDSAMDQFSAGKVWRVQQGATVEGGHYVPLFARRDGHWLCVTWGRVQHMTVSFFSKYCDEAYAILSTEHLHGGHSPEGLDREALDSALKSLG